MYSGEVLFKTDNNYHIYNEIKIVLLVRKMRSVWE
jgi:hypothetical protein